MTNMSVRAFVAKSQIKKIGEHAVRLRIFIKAICTAASNIYAFVHPSMPPGNFIGWFSQSARPCTPYIRKKEKQESHKVVALGIMDPCQSDHSQSRRVLQCYPWVQKNRSLHPSLPSLQMC